MVLRMTFGRYAGWPLDSIPVSYLAWVLSNCDNMERHLRLAIEREVERRASPGRWQATSPPPAQTSPPPPQQPPRVLRPSAPAQAPPSQRPRQHPAVVAGDAWVDALADARHDLRRMCVPVKFLEPLEAAAERFMRAAAQHARQAKEEIQRLRAELEDARELLTRMADRAQAG